ncbi:type II secretion system protein GspF, partial [Desulfobacterales bacterium HSG16]|nr:type II secretion system protein GspF [Desulfobacterales bacterium HSG16]
MTIYSYKASDPSGKIMKGVLEASDEKEIVSRIQDMGYIPIKIDRAGGIGKKKSRNKKVAKPTAASKQSFSLFSRISPKDVMNFTQDLCALLQAGLPVDRALSILTDSVENKRFSSIINDMLKSVQG